MKEHLILVGAEGVQELLATGPPWFREVVGKDSGDLYDRFRAENQLNHPTFAELVRDDTGRPYFLCAIREDAPDSILAVCKSHLRVLRLEA